MKLRSAWPFLRSWVVGLSRRRRRAVGGEIPPAGQTAQSVEGPGPGEPDQAIFQRGARGSPTPPTWAGRPPADDRELQQQVEKAVGQVLGSLDIRARVLDRDHLLRIALCLNDRAAQEKGEGHYQLAEALCQRALDIFEKVAAPDHQRLAGVLENCADLLHAAGRPAEAASLQARAAAIRARQQEKEAIRPPSRWPDARIQK